MMAPEEASGRALERQQLAASLQEFQRQRGDRPTKEWILVTLATLFGAVEREDIRVAKVFLPRKLREQLDLGPHSLLWGAKVLTSKSRGSVEVEGEDLRSAQRPRRARRGTFVRFNRRSWSLRRPSR